MTLADVAGLDLADVDLAYLAACQIAKGDLRLIDEALHLAAAFQMVGYRRVLAALWNISDPEAPAMAETVYAGLHDPAGATAGSAGSVRLASGCLSAHDSPSRRASGVGSLHPPRSLIISTKGRIREVGRRVAVRAADRLGGRSPAAWSG